MNVNYVLEGSVRKSVDRVRITAQLIDVSDDTQLWSESYERTLADVFAIQREISGAIVNALRDTLDQSGNIALPATGIRPTDNLQAYEHYLQGRYWLQNRTLFGSKGLRKGIVALLQSVQLDPLFSQAHATLAAIYAVYDGYAQEEADNSYAADQLGELAEKSALRALEIDESLADAYATLGLVYRDRNDWGAAIEHSRKAVELDSTNVLGHLWYGILLVQLGHIEQAKDILLTAAELDPASPLVAHWLADSYRILGEAEQSRFHGQRAIDLGGYAMADGLYLYHLQRGEYAAAIEVLEHTEKMLGHNIKVVRPLVAAVQDPARIPELLVAAGQFNAVLPNLNLGGYYLDIPKPEFVLELLESEGKAGRFSNYTYRLWEPQFTYLRNSPVFQRYAQEAGMVDYWKANDWPDICRETTDDFECD